VWASAYIADREGFNSHESALKFEEQLGTIFVFEKERCGETLRDTESIRLMSAL
jgi:hypothetical protein